MSCQVCSGSENFIYRCTVASLRTTVAEFAATIADLTARLAEAERELADERHRAATGTPFTHCRRCGRGSFFCCCTGPDRITYEMQKKVSFANEGAKRALAERDSAITRAEAAERERDAARARLATRNEQHRAALDIVTEKWTTAQSNLTRVRKWVMTFVHPGAGALRDKMLSVLDGKVGDV